MTMSDEFYVTNNIAKEYMQIVGGASNSAISTMKTAANATRGKDNIAQIQPCFSPLNQRFRR